LGAAQGLRRLLGTGKLRRCNQKAEFAARRVGISPVLPENGFCYSLVN
jgi:hypothetical protein